MFELIFDGDVSMAKGQRSDCVTQMPPDLGMTDFGFLPRDRYPLVAVLTLANTEDRDAYNIVSNTHSSVHTDDDDDNNKDSACGHYEVCDDDEDGGCCRW